MKIIEIIKPDDFHVHFRDGNILMAVVPETIRHFGRAIVMPNLIPPILNGFDAKRYKDEILDVIPKSNKFKPLMTLYLTENTRTDELEEAYQQEMIFAAKLYPAGATTNSEFGVGDISKIMPVLEKMSDIGMPLLIHGEVIDKEIDVFDREKKFIDTVLDFICSELPNLKITLEHITTKEATTYLQDSSINVSATITPHHLALNRNAIFNGGISPHYYCLPILKREVHRKALVRAATSGNPKFFLGTDTAPDLKSDKESECGCAGIFNATYCMSILAQLFDNENSLSQLENFTSINGAKHYNLKLNKEKIKLTKSETPITFEKTLKVNKDHINIFNPNFDVYWKVSTS